MLEHRQAERPVNATIKKRTEGGAGTMKKNIQ
jgi:hypothetical protein